MFCKCFANVLFYLLSSTCVQHAKTFAKNVLQMFCNILANILRMCYFTFYMFTCNHGLRPNILSVLFRFVVRFDV